ncbi:hypothetical protein [Microbacterium luteum]|uniref:hypothetical protein n=1 Tax=Microbacterium luteum TaxID=2782167 RepID=UPI0018875282|nr:hypothetical protein [Microbacterium luteum]
MSDTGRGGVTSGSAHRTIGDHDGKEAYIPLKPDSDRSKAIIAETARRLGIDPDQTNTIP